MAHKARGTVVLGYERTDYSTDAKRSYAPFDPATHWKDSVRVDHKALAGTSLNPRR